MNSIDNPQETKPKKRVFAMAGFSLSKYVKKFCALLVIMPIVVLTGCGQGDGPVGIQNEAATPLPTLPPGFCDPINFEIFCESPGIINFNGGATEIVENPDPSGINENEELDGELLNKVARMRKFPDQVFGGTKLYVPNAPIDFSLGEVYKVKVWSGRTDSVVVTLKLEEEGNPEGGFAKDATHTGGGEWQELCFDFTGQNVPPPVLALTIIFDNGTQGAADVDPDRWTFYYDDITQTDRCGDFVADPGIVPDVTLYYPAGDLPDLQPGVDYDEVTGLESGSVINPSYADDNTYGEVLAVTSGIVDATNIGQIGYIGFEPGFVTSYETLDFKVKGLPNFLLFVTLYEGSERLRINVSSSDFAEALDNGWYQVSIPISSFTGLTTATGIAFETDDTSPMQFTFFMSDIGFGEIDDGGGDGPAQGGTVPDATILEADGSAADLTATFTGFDSETGTAIIGTDSSYAQALEVTVANGYDVNLALAQLFITELSSLDSYDEFLFKVKGLTDNNLVLKIEPPAGGVAVAIDLTAPGAGITVEDLGDGWSQVVVALAQFGDLSGANVVILQTLDNAYAVGDTFLLTDIGFNIAGGGGNGGGTVLVTFDEAVPPAVTEFGGAGYAIEPGPAGGDGNALKIARDAGEAYAGAWVAIPSIPNDAGVQTVSALVYSPTAGVPIVTKAEFADNAGTGDVQANEAVVVGWQTLTWTYTCLLYTSDAADDLQPV